jgi:hypothetical protein
MDRFIVFSLFVPERRILPGIGDFAKAISLKRRFSLPTIYREGEREEVKGSARIGSGKAVKDVNIRAIKQFLTLIF